MTKNGKIGRVTYSILVCGLLNYWLCLKSDVVFYNSAPEQVAIHFDISNKPNSYVNKNIALFAFPSIIALVQIVCCITNDISKTRKDKTPKVEYVYKSILPVISIVVYIITLAIVLGAGLDVRKIVCFLVGFIFILVGNYIPKTNSTYNHGAHSHSLIKNERLWQKANRMIAYLLAR